MWCWCCSGYWLPQPKVFFPGDEGGESELLGEALPLEPSVAKAERSHLIVWQVMCGSEWACRMQLETLKMGGRKKKKSFCMFFFILWTCFTTWCWSISLLFNFILQTCHTFSYTGISLCCFTAPVLNGTGRKWEVSPSGVHTTVSSWDSYIVPQQSHVFTSLVVSLEFSFVPTEFHFTV